MSVWPELKKGPTKAGPHFQRLPGIQAADSLHNVEKFVEEGVVMQCNQRMGRIDPLDTQ